jgi:hypothetical protein
MASEYDWLEVTLDQGSRRGIADLLERVNADKVDAHLLRMLRSNRNELLLDRTQAKPILDALNTDGRLSAVRARLQAFLADV